MPEGFPIVLRDATGAPTTLMSWENGDTIEVACDGRVLITLRAVGYRLTREVPAAVGVALAGAVLQRAAALDGGRCAYCPNQATTTLAGVPTCPGCNVKVLRATASIYCIEQGCLNPAHGCPGCGTSRNSCLNSANKCCPDCDHTGSRCGPHAYEGTSR